jgi:hypothetical protein
VEAPLTRRFHVAGCLLSVVQRPDDESGSTKHHKQRATSHQQRVKRIALTA